MKLIRGLRRRQTDVEEKLWMHLRNRQIEGTKFRRQQAIGHYIVDFICYERKLIIEIDGGQHNEPSNIDQDHQRTIFLESRGYKVVRYWNNAIIENIDGVLVHIQSVLETKTRNQDANLTQASPVKGEEISNRGEDLII